MAYHLAILQQFSGINVVVVYGGPLLKGIVTNSSVLTVLKILLQATSLVGCFCTASLIKNLGRKTLLQIGALSVGILMGIMATCYIFAIPAPIEKAVIPQVNVANYLISVCLYLFMLMFGFTLGPLVWLYIPEVVKAKYVPFTTLTNWAGCTITVTLFPIL